MQLYNEDFVDQDETYNIWYENHPEPEFPSVPDQTMQVYDEDLPF